MPFDSLTPPKPRDEPTNAAVLALLKRVQFVPVGDAPSGGTTGA